MEKLRRILHVNTNKVKFNHQQQANFFLLLADLLSVGFSVKEALGFIKAVNPKLAPWIASIDKRMQKGASFAQSLQQEVKDDLFYPLDIDKITEISSWNINFDTVNNKAKLVDDNKLKEDYGYYLGQHYASGGNGSFPYQGKIQFEEIMSRFYEKYNENRNSKQF